jgi:hypothetical protein
MKTGVGIAPRWDFLQNPNIAIGVTEMSIFNAAWVFINLPDFQAQANECFACHAKVLHD